jgi:protein arginine N-methyltransferase 5
LYNAATALKSAGALETPYVVKFQAVSVLDQPKQCWTFQHPTPAQFEDNTHNTRYWTSTFKVKENSLIHGFAGYFDSVLYKDVMISTLSSFIVGSTYFVFDR